MTTARSSQEERQEISTTLSSTFQTYRGGPFARITHSVEERMILLMEIGLPECEDGVLLLKRSLRASKASRISINGSLATLANLQALGSLWIDFHGPGEPQRLLKNECQLEMIDLFARLQGEVEQYRNAYYEWRQTLSEIERLRNTTKLSQDQIDFLRQQIDRIGALELSPEFRQMKKIHGKFIHGFAEADAQWILPPKRRLPNLCRDPPIRLPIHID